MPIPLLIVIAILALFVYTTIGSIIGTFAVNLFSEKGNRENHLRILARQRETGDGAAEVGVFVTTIIWPVILAFLVVFCCPYFLSVKIIKYTAEALLERNQ